MYELLAKLKKMDPHAALTAHAVPCYRRRPTNSPPRVFGHNSLPLTLTSTRIHGNVPTSLPELPKPCRTSGKSKKTEFLNPNFYIGIKEHFFNLLINPFKGPY